MSLVTSRQTEFATTYLRSIWQSQRSSKVFKHLWLPILFCTILVANLTYHFFYQQVKATFSYDGYDYLFTGIQITNYIRAAIHGHLTWSMLSNPQFAVNITRDGPVIPGISVILSFLLGRQLAETDWSIFVIIFSVMQSISACLIGEICRRITGATWAGLISGILFGLYPTSLIASGLYRSEAVAILLELSFVLCLVLATDSLALSIVSSITAILLWMSKPALIPSIVVSIAVAVWKSPKYMRILLIFTTIFALIIIPWANYTRVIYGEYLITAARYPNSNAAAGCDLTTDGWYLCPSTTWQEARGRSPSSIIIGQWQKFPLPLFTLTMAKITRLFAYPWNALRETVFGVTPRIQQYYHLFVLGLCLFGIYAYLLGKKKLHDSQSYKLATLSLVMIIFHFTYLLFPCVGRYGYTAMPFLFTFAGYGLFYVKEHKLQNKVLVAGILALLSIVFISKVEALTKIGKPFETSHIIEAGVTLEKHIDLGTAKIPPGVQKALILIDCANQLPYTIVTINGHYVNEPVWLINHFGSEEYRMLRGFRELAALMNMSILDYRQWRAVAVPIDWVNLHGNNIIDITGGDTPGIVFGDSTETQHMPSFKYVIGDYLNNRMDGLERRAPDPNLTEPIIQRSLIKSAITESPKVLPDAVRIKLALISPEQYPEIPTKTLITLNHCTLKVSPSGFHLFAQDKSCSGMHVSRYLLKYLGGIFATINVPALTRSSHIEFLVSGECRILHGPGKIAISAAAIGPKNKEEFLELTPAYIKSGPNWQRFEITDLLPLGVIGNQLKQIRIGLWPLPWLDAQYGADRTCSEAQFRNIQVELHTRQLPDLSRSRVSFY